MTSFLKQVARRFLYPTQSGQKHKAHLHDLVQQRDRLLAETAALAQERDALVQTLSRYGDEIPFVPNGHYYSPVHSRKETVADADRIFRLSLNRPLADIDLQPELQLRLLHEIGELCADQPFTDKPQAGRRYGFDNPSYSYADALCLHGMLRRLRPRRLVEVGSGHSSCMTLDTREMFLGGQMDCTFIEPYPELLRSLIRTEDRSSIRVIDRRVQDVDLSVFRELAAGDVLFIDSTHVSKVGSDVNYLYFEVLPALADGVYIHIHDIFYPFEYPEPWVVDEGRAWNELYILRALLQGSKVYQVQLMTTYLALCHRAAFEQALPLGMKNAGGSIWLRKMAA